MKIVFCLTVFFFCFGASAQNAKGKFLRFYSTHAMFPDTFRNNHPRVYDGKVYATAEHYADSSTYVFVPDYFNKAKPYVLVLYFHGWNNNIDTALLQYQLQQQFYDAHQNAIFIFPESAKNAPDSYGGKWEQPGEFNWYMQELNLFLKEKGLITGQFTKPSLILAGHSGAYRVMSYILLYTYHTCKGTILFDALYGQTEKFSMYLKMHPSSRLINIYTDNGGTLQNSKDLEACFKGWHWPFLSIEEASFHISDIRNNRIIFLHSLQTHNEVVSANGNFTRFLQLINF